MTAGKSHPCGNRLTVYRWESESSGWGSGRRLLGCQDAVSLIDASNQAFPVTVVLASANDARECRGCRQALSTVFRIDQCWWADHCRNSNGYFGSEVTFDNKGKQDGINTWSLSLVKLLAGNNEYEWHKHNVFLRWNKATHHTLILILDASHHLQQQLFSKLLDGVGSHVIPDPMWFLVPLTEDLVQLQDQAVWALRTKIRNMEKSRETENPNFVELHDIARHVIHVGETLEVASLTMSSILRQHTYYVDKKFCGAKAGPVGGEVDDKVNRADDGDADALAAATSHRVHQRLCFFKDMLANLRCRAASNKERLDNEIQLTFNKVAQNDASHSLEIGRAARLDSKSMKYMGFATSVFLPSTFVSTLFSMSFFRFGDDGTWDVSPKIWLFVAFSVPVTILALVMWWRYRPRDDKVRVKMDRSNSNMWRNTERTNSDSSTLVETRFPGKD
ncbi:hypothetical protein N3K66_008520 [Trichothecium roseum]|uniref:Uncharacterized protein n=1 Tax=Trichothecium roseum TaxID=47278 RepID=A0ACC0UQT5_9HYPO|nr:hypothetical protein N3K66_008520 [Trichothecium roseum]